MIGNANNFDKNQGMELIFSQKIQNFNVLLKRFFNISKKNL
jgi:hypothetical protein